MNKKNKVSKLTIEITDCINSNKQEIKSNKIIALNKIYNQQINLVIML